jgi:hypothetical protein
VKKDHGSRDEETKEEGYEKGIERKKNKLSNFTSRTWVRPRIQP